MIHTWCDEVFNSFSERMRAMKTIQLTECECRLVDELLQQERRELQPEIHRTHTAYVKDTLHERYQKISQLIERLDSTESVRVAACACKGR